MPRWTLAEYEDFLTAIKETFADGPVPFWETVSGRVAWQLVKDKVGTGRSLKRYHMAYKKKPAGLDRLARAATLTAKFIAQRDVTDAQDGGSTSGAKREHAETDGDGQSDKDDLIIVEADEKKPGVGTGKTRKTPAVMPAPKKVKHEAFLELAGTLQMSKIKPRDSGPAPNGDITPVDKTQASLFDKMQAIFQLAAGGDDETKELGARFAAKVAADWGKDKSG